MSWLRREVTGPGKEKINPSRWAQCKDKGYRWGIMKSNGSESLNYIFKTC
jgi:hypothetical protein